MSEAINAAMQAIRDEIPARLNIVGILRDAHARIAAAAPGIPEQVVAEQVVEVLREIATHAVTEFNHRTGQQFLWVDDPEPPVDEAPVPFGIEVKDGKGYITF